MPLRPQGRLERIVRRRTPTRMELATSTKMRQPAPEPTARTAIAKTARNCWKPTTRAVMLQKPPASACLPWCSREAAVGGARRLAANVPGEAQHERSICRRVGHTQSLPHSTSPSIQNAVLLGPAGTLPQHCNLRSRPEDRNAGPNDQVKPPCGTTNSTTKMALNPQGRLERIVRHPAPS